MKGRTRYFTAPFNEEKPSPASDTKDEESHERPLFVVAFVIEHRQLRRKRGDEARLMGGRFSTIPPPGRVSQRQMRETKKREGELVSLTEELNNDLMKNAEKKEQLAKSYGMWIQRREEARLVPPSRP